MREKNVLKYLKLHYTFKISWSHFSKIIGLLELLMSIKVINNFMFIRVIFGNILHFINNRVWKNIIISVPLFLIGDPLARCQQRLQVFLRDSQIVTGDSTSSLRPLVVPMETLHYFFRISPTFFVGDTITFKDITLFVLDHQIFIGDPNTFSVYTYHQSLF